eukprot:1142779-Pelagomonas_calceolata.AAC.1
MEPPGKRHWRVKEEDQSTRMERKGISNMQTRFFLVLGHQLSSRKHSSTRRPMKAGKVTSLYLPTRAAEQKH